MMKNLYNSFSKLNSSIAFALASIFAGLIHYAVQIYAVGALTGAQFGEFSAWLAYLTIAQFLAAFVQILSNFWCTPNSRLKRYLLLSFIFTTILSVIQIDSSKVSLAIIAVGYSLLLGWLSGQLQIRLQFYSLAATSIILAAAKVLICSFYLSDFAQGIYLAFVYSTLPGIIYALFCLSRVQKDRENLSRKSSVKDIIPALLISFYYVFIPNVDLIVVDLTQDRAILDKFAPLSLLYKIVFSLLIIVYQILLPHQLKNHSASATYNSRRIKLYQIFLGVLSLGVLCEIILSVLMKIFSSLPTGWIFLASVHILFASYLYLLIQELLTKAELKSVLFALLTHILAFLFFIFVQIEVETFLALIGVVDLVIIVILRGVADARDQITEHKS